MQFVFRVDASRSMGTGHVMRCLTLAASLKEQGVHCHFICREHEGHLLGLIRQQGFEATGLPLAPAGSAAASADDGGTAYGAWLGDSWGHDVVATIAALTGPQADWLVVDHYAIDARWEDLLRPHCRRLMVIDDLADRAHHCDLLLDQNAVADAETRYTGLVPESCHLMLGPAFALLQPPYVALHAGARVRGAEIRRVLVYFGGADTGNLTGLAVEALLALGRPDIAVDVVVDPAHPQARAMETRVRPHRHVTLHGRLPSLAPLMQEADLAIGAGGTTSWERCCLGLPALVITLADNQKPIAAELERRGALRWLGHQDEVSVDMLRQALADVITQGLAAAWSRCSLAQVDGLGTARVGEVLLLSGSTPLRARLAGPRDEALLLRWANDPLVRRNSFAQGAISPASHHDWFQKRLASSACRIYLLETVSGLAVGQVRFERDEACWWINYTVDASCRGRGLGKSVLTNAMAALNSDVGAAPLMASVKAGNAASLKVFEALGFIREPDAAGQDVHRFRAGQTR